MSVVSIDGTKQPTSKEVSEDCLDMLGKWLGMVKSGDITSIAICGIREGGNPVTGISEDQPSICMMVGGLEVLQKRLMDGIDDDR